MRKHCTQIVSLALVLAVLLSLMVPAFAAGAGDSLYENGMAAEEPEALPEEETVAAEPETEPAGEPEEETSAAEPDAEPAGEPEEVPDNAEHEPAGDMDKPPEETPPEADEMQAEDAPEENEGEGIAEDYGIKQSARASVITLPNGNVVWSGDDVDAEGFMLSHSSADSSQPQFRWAIHTNGTLTIRGAVMPDYPITADDKSGFLLPPWSLLPGDFPRITKIVIEPGIRNISANLMFGTEGEYVTSISIPDTVTSIGEGAFQNCASLESISIPGSVKTIGAKAFLVSAYEDKSSILKNIELHEGTTTIGDKAFYDVPVSHVTLPASLTGLGSENFAGAFIDAAPGNPAYCSVDGILYNKDCTQFVNIPKALSGAIHIPEGIRALPEGRSEGDSFWNCEGITEISLPSTLGFDGFAGFASQFWQCGGLKRIDVAPENPELCSVDGIVYSKDRTVLIRVPNGFFGHLSVPEGVQSIQSSAMIDCALVTGINLPDTLKEIGDSAFEGCTGLTSIHIPASVAEISSSAFSNCTGLTSVNIPASVTEIGSSAFYGCTGLTSVNIPASVKEIGSSVFSGCTGLTSVQLPSGLLRIGQMAFQSSGLTSIRIPAGVTEIHDFAFMGCRNLQNIFFLGSAPEFIQYDTSVYSNRYFADVTATVYYPANDESWMEQRRLNYGGQLTWVAVDSSKRGWQNDGGWRYFNDNGYPLTGSNWIEALGHRYVFDDNGILQTGNAAGDLLWEGNQYYLNPAKNLDDPSTCYCVTEYTRNRPGVGVTYYNRDGITYRGWVDGGDGKLLYQTVLLGKDGKELKDADGFSTYIYVWGGQQIPAGRDPLDEKKTIPAGNYLFGEDGVLVTGRTGWYTIPGSSAIAGEYYLTDANGHCALNTTRWDNVKGHRYLFGADGRKVAAGKDGRDVGLTINGQYQTVYLAPNTDYVACEYYRPRKDSKGGDLGLTYYNPDGITYRGWVDGGSGKRLYQTVMEIEGKDLYFIVWRAQYLPAGKDPVTKDPIPAGWYLFDNDGVLITKDGTYTYPDTKGVDHRYQVKDGKIVAVDGKAPTAPGSK